MAVCGCTSGMLFWKKPCDRIALDACATCGTGICAAHAQRPRPGRFYCPDCVSKDEDSDTDGDTGSSSSSSWFSSENSSSSDSSSSDSGGGDSGGSSSD